MFDINKDIIIFEGIIAVMKINLDEKVNWIGMTDGTVIFNYCFNTK